MERLIPIHNELLLSVAREHARLGELPLTSSFPASGTASTGELMVVGRAVNAWSARSWTANAANDSSQRAEIIRDVLAQFPPSCPMQWVTDAWGNTTVPWNAKKSPFWRLNYHVAQSMFGASEHWPSRLIWSNLYKVAPYSGGNPGTRLAAAQQSLCEAHLAKEIEIWKPKRILFITGWDWAKPFFPCLGEASGKESTDVIQWSGAIETSNGKADVVVSVRPERRRDVPLAQAIVKAFND